MSAIIFNGKDYARKKEKDLKKQVAEMEERGIKPHLTSILIGNNENSELYLILKQRAAQRVGVRLDIIKIKEDTPIENLINVVGDLNKVNNMHGIMVQLPLPTSFSKSNLDNIINTIDSKKDVDGMKNDSKFDAPVVLAVIDIMKKAKVGKKEKVVVVGSDGFVGNKLFNKLKKEGYFVKGLDIKDNIKKDIKESDVVISATGKRNLITGDIISKNSVVIDVGAPEGDIDALSVSKKARFISPVPGGVGPVTIYKLLENLVEATKG